MLPGSQQLTSTLKSQEMTKMLKKIEVCCLVLFSLLEIRMSIESWLIVVRCWHSGRTTSVIFFGHDCIIYELGLGLFTKQNLVWIRLPKQCARSTKKSNWFFNALFCSSSQFLMSPVYPKYYVGGRRCRWTLRADPGQRIQLRFLDIREDSSQKILECCSHQTPEPIRTWNSMI